MATRKTKRKGGTRAKVERLRKLLIEFNNFRQTLEVIEASGEAVRWCAAWGRDESALSEATMLLHDIADGIAIEYARLAGK